MENIDPRAEIVKVVAKMDADGTPEPHTRNTGGDVNYYLVRIDKPKRLEPYTMEVEDVIEALDAEVVDERDFAAELEGLDE